MSTRGLALVILFAGLLTGRPAPAQQEQTATPVPSPAQTSSQSANPDLTPDANGALSQDQMRELFRIVADKDIENDRRLRDYTYVERDVEHGLDGKGQVKSTEIKTYDVMELYGESARRLIQKDDKPLDGKDSAKEEEKLQKLLDKRKNESEGDRRKREEKEEKEREDNRKFVREVADAYNFKLLGTESIDGREAWIIDGEPKPGYEPQMKEAKLLPKFRGRIWIDKADLQWSKLDLECIDTVSVGWVLARLHKGTRIMIEQTRINDEVWLLKHVAFKVDARVALLKGFNVDGDQTFRDYKKFRSTAKIVGMGEVKPETK
jgi:hypothetical protein